MGENGSIKAHNGRIIEIKRAIQGFYFSICGSICILASLFFKTHATMIHYIRSKKWVTNLFMFLTLGLFIIIPATRIYLAFFKSRRYIFAAIGEYELKPREYRAEVDSQLNELKRQYGKGIMAKHPYYAVLKANQKAWNRFVFRYVIEKSFKESGVVIPRGEVEETLFGKNTPEEIKNSRYFQDENGDFDQEKFTNYIEYMQKTSSPHAIKQFERDITRHRYGVKIQLIKEKTEKSTLLEKKRKRSKNKIKIEVVYIKNSALSSKQAIKNKLSEKEIRAYYNKNKAKYQRKAGKKVFYTILESPIFSSDMEEKVAFQKEGKEIAKNFAASKDPLKWAKEFAKEHEYAPKKAHVSWSEEDLPLYLKNLLENKKNKEEVIGPIEENQGLYVFYRFIEKKEVKGKIHYYFARLYQRAEPSQKSQLQTQLLAEELSKKSMSKEKFEQACKKEGYFMREVYIPREEAEFAVGQDRVYDKLTKSVHKYGAKVGKALPVITGRNDNIFYVALIEKEYPKGVKTFDEAKKEVIDDLIAQKQQDEIKKIYENLGENPSIKKVKNAFAHNSTYKTTIPIDPFSYYIKNIGECPEVIGKAMAMEVGDQSYSIIKSGLVVFKCLSKEEKKLEKKEEAKQNASDSFFEESFIKEKEDRGEIEDNRFAFDT